MDYTTLPPSGLRDGHHRVAASASEAGEPLPADHTPSQWHLTYSPQETQSPAVPSLPPEPRAPRGAPLPTPAADTLGSPDGRGSAWSRPAEKTLSKVPPQAEAEFCLDTSNEVTLIRQIPPQRQECAPNNSKN